jgi:hypothetical protein
MSNDPAPVALQPALARLKADLATRHAPPLAWASPQPVAQPVSQPIARAVLAGPGEAGEPVSPAPGRAGALVWVSAALLATLALAWSLRPLPGMRPQPSPAVDLASMEDEAGGSGFLPVAPPERFDELWQGGAQAAPAWVVRTELPRERLAALGLPYDPARAGEPVRAELLMHPAGDVLAVRLTR